MHASLAAYPFLTDAFNLAVFAGLIILGLVLVMLRGRKPWLAHIQSRPLLTTNEREFFYRIQRALPAYIVFPQIAFGAFLTDDGKLSHKAR